MKRVKHPNINIRDELKLLGMAPSAIPVESPLFFGQCAEDYIVLSALRALADREGLNLAQHSYLEIGANHPVSTSATYLLHIGLGMSGVLVDANSALIPALKKNRPADRILNVAITDDPNRTEVDFYVASHSELSSLNPEFIKNFAHVNAAITDKITLPCCTVNALMRSHFPLVQPLFVSIDVEGMDAAIVESLDLDTWRPYIIQVECNRTWDQPGFDRISRKLTAGHYVAIAQTDVNLIVVDRRRLGASTPTSAVTTATASAEHGYLPSLRLSEASVAALLQTVDVLTVDIFDTLLVRRCLTPEDVFGLMAERAGLRAFQDARIQAELRARRNTRPGVGSEVSLEEIYSALEDAMPQAARMAEAELATEKKVLRANPDMVKVLKLARQQGKRVIAISDIYLSSARLSGLLLDCGIEVDRVYSSCDHRDQDLGKYNGKLFAHVLAQEGLSAHRVMHMGDNYTSDVTHAQHNGIQSLHVLKTSELASASCDTFKALKHLHINATAGAVLGLIAHERLQPGHAAMSSASRFGFDVGGPLLLGFIKFMLDAAKRDGVQHLALLARDGIIIERALNLLKPAGITWGTCLASRRMSIFPRYAEEGWTVISRFFPEEALTEAEFMCRLCLDDIIDHDRSSAVKHAPQALADRFHDSLLKQAHFELAQLRGYYADLANRHNSGQLISWVDVGWALTTIDALNKLLAIDAGAIFVGSHELAKNPANYHGYLFQHGVPVSVTECIMPAVEIIELIFTDTSASTAYVSKDGEGWRPRVVPQRGQEHIRARFIDEVQQGALRFISQSLDLVDHLNAEQLRQYNRVALSLLAKTPPASLYQALASVPHDRVTGQTVWQSIGDHWRPRLEPAAEPAVVAQSVGQSVEAKASTNAKTMDKVSMVALQLASKLHPPLPKRMTERFAKSAAKRRRRLKAV